MSKLRFLSIVIFSIIYFNPSYSQPQKGEFIDVSAGFGICAPYDETDITGSGFYAQAEYVWSPKSWFGIRPYAGIIIASGESDETGMNNFSIKSNAALLGVKFRVAAPIPYIAPFIESGIGMSIGSFETHTATLNVEKNGVLLHVPISIGVAIGRKHNYEIKFTYFYHNAVDQFSGAAALGFSFPITED